MKKEVNLLKIKGKRNSSLFEFGIPEEVCKGEKGNFNFRLNYTSYREKLNCKVLGNNEINKFSVFHLVETYLY